MKPSATFYCKDDEGRDLSAKEWIDFVASKGFRCIEIAVHALPKSDDEKSEIIKYARDKGFEINLHSNYGPNNITDTDEENRRLSIDQHKASIDLAAKYGLGVVVFHPGRRSDPSDSKAEKWDLMFPAVEEIAEYAKQKKVRVGIENMEWRKNEIVHTVDDLNRFAYIAENNPYFGATVDFGHYASKDAAFPDIFSLKLPIFDVHLSQFADGKAHHPITYEGGVVDFERVFRALAEYGYQGFTVFETGGGYADGKRYIDEIIAKL